jgi:hypothetical protein
MNLAGEMWGLADKRSKMAGGENILAGKPIFLKKGH